MADSDVFGHALLAWAHGAKDPEIVERDDGFTDTGAGPEVYLSPVRGWPTAEKKAIRLATGRVLDVGCGAGRVSLYLQEKGFDVVGLDYSRHALDAAQHLGVSEVLQAPIEVIGRHIEDFDTIVMFGNNVGIFGSTKNATRQLSLWAKAARPGTQLLLESTSPYFGGAPSMDRRYCERNKARGRSPGQARFRYRYEHLVGEWFDWIFVTKNEMRLFVKETGWKIVEFIGTSSDEPYVAVLKRDSDF